jgi:putative Mg2+ transporter-C (MgtC) family protein
MLTNMSVEWQILVEVLVAMVLGGAIGFEREVANKPAGFRTHMLVAGSAALLVAMAFMLVDQSLNLLQAEVVAADPIRIIQALTIGVSFLGAGTIVRGRRPDDVQGLTTAASLLMSSAIGVAVALRLFVLAVAVTVLVVVVLRVVGRIEGRLHE